MTSPYRVLVTGSRDWHDDRAVWHAIAVTILEQAPAATPVVVVHGACPHGADAHASAWAHLARADGRRPVAEERHPADWQQHGKAAGFRRNAEMVALGADVCLAFIRNGSRGASHTAALAEQAGIPVRRYTA
ncbi:SLOG family protein [Streptomyces sp. NPDC091412]|uniref:SLOG family protein n=1 Tax=Streptomyces sp. NPDC091412 TaxID=3366002 RepID=UPI0038037764